MRHPRISRLIFGAAFASIDEGDDTRYGKYLLFCFSHPVDERGSGITMLNNVSLSFAFLVSATRISLRQRFLESVACKLHQMPLAGLR
jgi:hypothetical protein